MYTIQDSNWEKQTETKLVALINDAVINCLNKHFFKASVLMDNSMFETSKFKDTILCIFGEICTTAFQKTDTKTIMTILEEL